MSGSTCYTHWTERAHRKDKYFFGFLLRFWQCQKWKWYLWLACVVLLCEQMCTGKTVILVSWPYCSNFLNNFWVPFPTLNFVFVVIFKICIYKTYMTHLYHGICVDIAINIQLIPHLGRISRNLQHNNSINIFIKPSNYFSCHCLKFPKLS